MYFLYTPYRYHMVTDERKQAEHPDVPIRINQDANIYVTEINPSSSVPIRVHENRQAYFLCVEGNAVVFNPDSNQVIATLVQHDAAEIYGPFFGHITTSEDSQLPAHLLLVEMEYTGEGRTDI